MNDQQTKRIKLLEIALEIVKSNQDFEFEKPIVSKELIDIASELEKFVEG